MQRSSEGGAMRRGATGRAGAGAAAVVLAAGLLVAALAGPAAAQRVVPMVDEARGPVVLELYTAQGCAACPPADAMLAELASRRDVIALALHVDYWDYIGWADVFADPEHGERQKRYARRNGLNTIYTPQVVINGEDILEGFRVMQVMEAIEAHLTAPPVAMLSVERGEAGTVEIRGLSLEPPPLIASRAMVLGAVVGALAADALPASEVLHDVQLVRYMRHSQVEITDGENAGLTADYVNIVTSWQSVGTWDLREPLALTVPVEGDEPVVVLLQAPGQGSIVSAARLD